MNDRDGFRWNEELEGMEEQEGMKELEGMDKIMKEEQQVGSSDESRGQTACLRGATIEWLDRFTNENKCCVAFIADDDDNEDKGG